MYQAQKVSTYVILYIVHLTVLLGYCRSAIHIAHERAVVLPLCCHCTCHSVAFVSAIVTLKRFVSLKLGAVKLLVDRIKKVPHLCPVSLCPSNLYLLYFFSLPSTASRPTHPFIPAFSCSWSGSTRRMFSRCEKRRSWLCSEPPRFRPPLPPLPIEQQAYWGGTLFTSSSPSIPFRPLLHLHPAFLFCPFSFLYISPSSPTLPYPLLPCPLPHRPISRA